MPGFLLGQRWRGVMLELHCLQMKNSVLGHRMDLVVHGVVDAARHMGTPAAAAVAERRYQEARLSREPGHHAEGLAVVGSEGSANFVSLRPEASVKRGHP